MRFVIKLVLVAVSLLVAAYFIDGIEIDRFWPTAVIAAGVLGFLNAVIKPVIKIFALPITILTLGLFGLVINVVIFWFINIVPGVTIDGFWSALWGALIVSILGCAIDMITEKEE